MILPDENTDAPVRRCNKSRVIYQKKSLSKKAKRRMMWCGIILFTIVILCVLFAFVGLPLIFMNSITLQRLLMFTTWGLHNDRIYFQKFEIKPGIRNLYVSVTDLKSKQLLSLGVWHMLPYMLQDTIITNEHFDFDGALKSSDRTVLLYFHGTGEDRSFSLQKYTTFRFFFHVVAFDYRSYGDSSTAELSEDAVVNDCVQIYEWLTTKTSAPIVIWGHSLGTALASRTVATLRAKANLAQPAGLVLEAPFTKMSEELYVHPYGKIFAWLPWFEATIVKPLQENGFIFDNKKYVAEIDCPIMILNAEDDSIVPYRFGNELYEIAKNRTVMNTTLHYQFAKYLGYNHNFIYRDPFLPYFIKYVCLQWKTNRTIFKSDWRRSL